METVLITGGRGFVGAELALYLAYKGYQVKALHRPGSKLRPELLRHENIQAVAGDITNADQMREAVKGCSVVYHLAAFAKPWARDMRTFYRVNVDGTINVLEACLANGVQRAVITSSAGTFGPQTESNYITENIEQKLAPFTEYERTKALAAEEALRFIPKGLEVIFVSPTRVFGPGELSVSNSVTRIIERYIYKGFRFMPGNGETIGNYAFISDVVQGHHLAAERGVPGENYILGGDNLSYKSFFNKIGSVSGLPRKMIAIPLPIMMAAAKTMEWMGNTFSMEPAITPPFIRKYMHNWGTDLTKAKSELDYHVTPFDEALKETIDWLERGKS